MILFNNFIMIKWISGSHSRTSYRQWCSRFPLKEMKSGCHTRNKVITIWMLLDRTHWTSCSARSLGRAGALAPAAPTSRSSPSNWQSFWPKSLWADVQTGSRWPPRCPDPTVMLVSSSEWPDWPAAQTNCVQSSALLIYDIHHVIKKINSSTEWYSSFLNKNMYKILYNGHDNNGALNHAQCQISHLHEIFSGLQVQEWCWWSVIMLLSEQTNVLHYSI